MADDLDTLIEETLHRGRKMLAKADEASLATGDVDDDIVLHKAITSAFDEVDRNWQRKRTHFVEKSYEVK